MPPTTKPIRSYLWFCHRLPVRSFFYHGKQFPVCARCTGLWPGYLAGIVLFIITPIPWYVAIVLIIPAVVDGGTQLMGWRKSNNPLRLVTGLALGIGEVIIVLIIVSWVIQLGYQFGQSLGY